MNLFLQKQKGKYILSFDKRAGERRARSCAPTEMAFPSHFASTRALEITVPRLIWN